MNTLTNAMKKSLGHLHLRALHSTAFVGSDGEPTKSVDIFPPGAVVGRGDDADIRVVDDEGYVSRLHVLIEPQALEWVVRDHDSAHGTRLQGPGKRLDLPAQVPVPLVTGDEVILARIAGFSIEVIVTQPSGARTKDAPPLGTIAYISDPDVLQLANELLRPRRENPQTTTAPSANDLSQIFHIDERTVYFRLDKLKAMDPIKRRIPAKRASMNQVADAIASAYPYLASPRGTP